MQNAILVLHMIICVVLVGAVLMQRSEGGALGMGGGGTGGLISGRGAADMMVNITSWVGGAFFVTSVFLAVLASSQPADRSVIPETGAKSGIPFSIPGFPKSESAPASTAPAAILPAAPISGDSALAPAPVEAVTRAGPLTAAPVGAAPPPAASLPGGAQPVGAASKASPSGAASKQATAPQKTGPAAPMIPLPAAPSPAPAAESAQGPSAVSPERQKAGPDE